MRRVLASRRYRRAHLTRTEHETLTARWVTVGPAGFPAQPGDGYLTAAATLPEHRHRGHFAALLNETLDWFHAIGTNVVITMCWRQDGDNSYTTFRDTGFETIANMPAYWDGYPDAATLMRRRLQ